MEDINELRNKINQIDLKILKLFEERLELMPKIADYKRNNKLPVYDEKREKEHLSELLKNTKEEDRIFIQKLFIGIMEISKEKQTAKYHCA